MAGLSGQGGGRMNAHATIAGFPFEVYRAIGDDRYVTPGELPPESGDAGRALWEVYDRHFGRFTGASLDPAFSRFVRADVPFGQPRFPAGSPVVVAGGGPGLDAVAADLRTVRARVLVVTDPTGAAALQRHALTPDLVLVEREPGGREDAPRGDSLILGSRAAVLIEPSAPIAGFERGAAIRRLARDLPSWGVWPATAVAVALRGGATRVVTLGLDGLTEVDERARTDALLSALALHTSADCLEVGTQSGRAGWWPVSWPNVVPIDAPGSAALSWHDVGDTALLRVEAERDLLFLAPLLPHAREALALACRARAGETVTNRDLCRAIEMLLVWGADPSIRWALQRALGLTFLPRLWRTGVSMAEPQRLWRPIILALHELTEQADRFESRLTTLANAAPREGGPSTALLDQSHRERRRPTRVETSRVSVVIPVLEEHPHLEDAIASLAEQTYGEVEILIVHDTARAARCAPLRALPLSNVRVLPHQGSYVDALNAGLEAATGAFVVIHGADDRSHPQRLARQVAYLQEHPEIGVLASATGSVGATRLASHHDGHADDAAAWTPEAIEVRLRSGPCFEHGSAIARRDAVRQAGGYRVRAGSPPDHDLWVRLVSQVRFAKLPTRLYLRRIGA
ncbi:MAG: glycosyltransferase [Vicinamibacteraceae bacterium]